MKCRDSEISPTGELDVPTQHRIMVNETNKWTFAKVPAFPLITALGGYGFSQLFVGTDCLICTWALAVYQ